MRLHEQLGGPAPDDEVEHVRASQRREQDDGADDPLCCPDCGMFTNDGEQCSECLSEQAAYFIPDEGGSQ